MVKTLKVLIISHNPITTYQSMGKTLASLFSNFNCEDLCQLYIYPTIPDIDFCSSYYRVTDKDVLDSYFKFSVNGRTIKKEEINIVQHSMYENDGDKNLYSNKKNKNSFRMICRDLIWKFSHWYNKDLKNWLKEQGVTHIFVAPGMAKFIYNIALKISKDFNLPIISYVCDDYYFVKKPKGVLDRIRVRGLQKKIKKLMKKTSHLVTICEDLSQLYSKEFSVPSTVIMTGTNYSISKKTIIKDNPTSITYMGNIRCNRYNSLVEIGKALQEINSNCNTDYHLNLYTVENDNSILEKFEGISTIRMCGYVTGEEFDKIFHSADILLHTEAFDSESIDMVKNSVSTKIADSLASGIPLLAYGPKEVASMQHLIKNDCAVTATNKDELEKLLYDLFETPKNVIGNRVDNALKVARNNHDSVQTGYKLKRIFEGVSN